MRIHHIGYLVKKLEKARTVFAALGYTEKGGVVYDEYRDMDILFMEKDGYTIELVSPKSKRSVVAELIKNTKMRPTISAMPRAIWKRTALICVRMGSSKSMSQPPPRR